MKKIILFILLIFTLCNCVTIKNYYWQYSEYDLIRRNSLYFIQLTVNNKTALFLIDSGSSKSFLDITQYDKYEFMYIDKPIERYIGIGGFQNIYTVFGYEIKEMFVPMLGINLEELNPYFKSDNIKITGIIGSEYLLTRNAVIDYENNKLYLK
jgi:hypothetical protein